MSDTPFPFLPPWKLSIGPVVLFGKGLISEHSRELYDQLSLVDDMTYLGSNFTISVKPKLGEIWVGSGLDTKTQPGNLVWFRRMYRDIGSIDHNTGAAMCDFYGLGIDTERTGWRILEDGSAIKEDIA